MPDSVLQDAGGGAGVKSGQIIHPTLLDAGTGLPIVILTGDTGVLSWQIVGSYVQMWWMPNTFTDASSTTEDVFFILDPSLTPDLDDTFYFLANQNFYGGVFIERGSFVDVPASVEFTINSSEHDTRLQGWGISYKLLHP